MMNKCMIVVFSAVLLLSFCASGQKCKNGCEDKNDCTADKCVAGSCQHDQNWNSASTPPSGCCKADADCTNDNHCIFGICETSKFKCRYITQCNSGKPPASAIGEPIACSNVGDCIRENENICLSAYCNAGVCNYNVKKDIKGCCNTGADCPTLPCRDVACSRKTKQCVWSSIIRTPTNTENCDEAIPSDFFREPIDPFSSFQYYQPTYYYYESGGSSGSNNPPPPPSSPNDEPGAGDVIGAIIGFVILGLLVIAFIIVIIMILVRNLWRRIAGKQ